MAGIDFSLRVETETDPYGPMVIVVRTMFNGMVEKVRMQAALAADSILGHPGNGVVYRSARIVFCGVYDEWCFSHVPMISNGYGQFEITNRCM
jgi:hypothetical protein